MQLLQYHVISDSKHLVGGASWCLPLYQMLWRVGYCRWVDMLCSLVRWRPVSVVILCFFLSLSFCFSGLSHAVSGTELSTCLSTCPWHVKGTNSCSWFALINYDCSNNWYIIFFCCFFFLQRLSSANEQIVEILLSKGQVMFDAT